MNFQRNKAFGSEATPDNKIVTRSPEEFAQVAAQERRGELIILALDVLSVNGHYVFWVHKKEQKLTLTSPSIGV